MPFGEQKLWVGSPLLFIFGAKAIFLRYRQVSLRATLSQASENYTKRYA